MIDDLNDDFVEYVSGELQNGLDLESGILEEQEELEQKKEIFLEDSIVKTNKYFSNKSNAEEQQVSYEKGIIDTEYSFGENNNYTSQKVNAELDSIKNEEKEKRESQIYGKKAKESYSR